MSRRHHHLPWCHVCGRPANAVDWHYEPATDGFTAVVRCHGAREVHEFTAATIVEAGWRVRDAFQRAGENAA